jgi:hypothetical protein
MKLKIISLLCFLMVLEIQGQELKTNQIRKLESFGIEYKSLIIENPNYGVEFMEILKKERKRKRSKTVGHIFSGLGLLTTTGGILILTSIKNSTNNSNDEMDHMDESGAYVALAGGIITVIGINELGISIPLFFSSRKNKKERDKLIMKFNPNFKE